MTLHQEAIEAYWQDKPFKSWVVRLEAGPRNNLLTEIKYVRAKDQIPLCREQLNKKGLYLNLYHGREDLSEDMAGWGKEGPLIGPLTRLKVTYLNTITLCFIDELDALRYGLSRDLPELIAKEDCIEFNGIYYGDWSLEHHQGMIS